MIIKGLFTQLMMAVMAVGIGYFYLMPTFSTVAQIEEDIKLYQEERTKIDAVNQELRSLVDRLEGVPAEDQRRLLTYMPDQVDELAVSRLLQNLTRRSGVLLEDVGYQEVNFDYVEAAEAAGVDDVPVPHEFSLSVQGTYEQIKNLLALFESNEYPLEVHTLEIGVVEGVFLQAEMTIVTYSHQAPPASVFTTN